MKKSIAKIISAIIIVAMIAGFPIIGGALKANAQGIDTTLTLNDQWTDGTINVKGDIDCYTITLPSAGWLTISVQGSSSYCDCDLLRADLTKINWFHVQGTPSNPETKTMTHTLEPGQYKFKVKSTGTEAMNYKIKGSFKPAENNEVEPNNVFAQGMDLAEGQTVTGFFSKDDSVDFYKINIPTKRNIRVTVTSKIYGYNYIHLFDKDYQEIFWQLASRGSEDAPAIIKKDIELEAGLYYIRAKDEDDADVRGRYDIKWETLPTLVSSITISGKKSVEEGAEIQLSAKALPDNASNKTLKWSTSNKKIATVDHNGLVTGVKAGKVTITATATDESGIKGTYEITVKKPNVKKVASVKATAKKGKKVALTWKKQKNAKKYQIQIATDKKFKKYRVDTTTKNNKNKLTIKYELKGTAYVRIRAISKNGGKGAWSKTVSVKVK